MKSIIHFVAIAALMLTSAALSAEEDAEDGDDMPEVSFEEKLAACGACHGENGDKPLLPEYPILAGQFESYLANSLRQYRDGIRTNQIMALQLQILALTDQDIDRLAAHFAAKPSPLHGLGE